MTATAISADAAAPSERLLTADELAARWQVPRSWVYAASRTGRIPTVRLGHYYRYRLSAVESWEERQEAEQ